jgi:hypothetical protein
MDQAHKFDVPLAHQVDVSEALHYLVKELGCDDWYVACHHDHLFVFRLKQGSQDCYAVRIECHEPVEKGVFHQAKAWSLSISMLPHELARPSLNVKQLERGLARLACPARQG